jgi:hypothetical protein
MLNIVINVGLCMTMLDAASIKCRFNIGLQHGWAGELLCAR